MKNPLTRPLTIPFHLFIGILASFQFLSLFIMMIFRWDPITLMTVYALIGGIIFYVDHRRSKGLPILPQSLTDKMKGK